MKSACLLAVVVLATPAFGGGDSWEFKVRTATPDGHIELVPTVAGDNFPWNCPVLIVEARYAWWKWLFENPPPSRSSHASALKYLAAAQVSGASIRFGSMGHGLHSDPGASACTVASRGLALVKENDGANAVYSYYEE